MVRSFRFQVEVTPQVGQVVACEGVLNEGNYTPSQKNVYVWFRGLLLQCIGCLKEVSCQLLGAKAVI